MRLALFDMDGTITAADTTLDFIRQSSPRVKKFFGCFLVMGLIALYLLRIITDTRGKEIFYRYFFGKCREDRFRDAAMKYCVNRLPSIVRKSSLDKIRWHLAEGHEVVVVTATVDLLVEGWCRSLGMALIANELEYAEGRVTGKIAGKNCYGGEKVRRIRERYRLEEYEFIYAYGDTAGDAAMLALAGEAHYRLFR